MTVSTETELHATTRLDKKTISFRSSLMLPDSAAFNRIKPTLKIDMTDNMYTPKAFSPKSDWVASVTVPAFTAYLAKHGDVVKHFCTIGTGSGIDALMAIELFGPLSVTLTDLHRTVVEEARNNVEHNMLPKVQVTVHGFTGDLSEPLAASGRKFDLIYENLPNIPIINEIDFLLEGINSSSFITPTKQFVPHAVQRDLLELHYRFLKSAQPFLTEQGRIISSIGARRPLESIIHMPELLGYQSELLCFTWKIQSEAKDVINGYQTAEQNGAGPFHFYKADLLETQFRQSGPVTSLVEALKIELALRPSQLSPQEAMRLSQAGEPIGHTVAIIESSKI